MMTDRYPFAGDTALVSHEHIIWSENDCAEQKSLVYSSSAENTLTDSINECYVTADEDNATQYLSVLESTTDITLEDLHNITLENQKGESTDNLQFVNENEEALLDGNSVELSGQQVVVFTVDGSDELYGIQVAQDDEGNVQKFQFKFRANEDGQLEAIPESIQLLLNDESEENIEVVQDTIETSESNEEIVNVNIVTENEVEEIQSDILESGETVENSYFHEEEIQEEKMHEDETYNQEGDENVEFDEEETIDSKAGILEENMKLKCNIKEEIIQEETQQLIEENIEENTQETVNFEHVFENPESIENENAESAMDDIQNDPVTENEGIVHYEGYDEDENEVTQDVEPLYPVAEIEEPTNDKTHYEEMFIQENHVIQNQETLEEVVQEGEEYDHPDFVDFESSHTEEEEEEEEEETANNVENESEIEDYQVVEGLHITGDIEVDGNVEKTSVLEDSNVLKPKEDKVSKSNRMLVYYVVQHPEKENLDSLSMHNATIYKPAKANPRSILKSSCGGGLQKDEDMKFSDERLGKRFARSKEAVQARLFHNFISKTTIPQAPVRHERLPRKQKINPVNERVDEEIIVQEVMVSSNGFVQPLEDGVLKNKENLAILDYVELSDSEDDYDPKKKSKRKKKGNNKIKSKCGRSDGEVSDISIIEIPSDEDGDDTGKDSKKGRGKSVKKCLGKIEFEQSPGKRRRGRPPKNSKSPTANEVSDISSCESPSKKGRIEDTEEHLKSEVKCPKCTKSFPSPNSLKTHLQHHDLENSLRRSQIPKGRPSILAPTRKSNIVFNHKCEKCDETFKNSILLKRHVCTKSVANLNCSICQKKFPNQAKLATHKKTHVKSQMVKNTSVVKISPKKSLSKRISVFKSPKKLPTFKCKDCDKVCNSRLILSIHEKTHLKFKCSTCPLAFTSRILLDTHKRESCVKAKSPQNKRLSIKIRRSFANSPRRQSITRRFSSRQSTTFNPTVNKTATKSFLNKNVPILNKTPSKFNLSVGISLECDICSMKFTSNSNLFKHKVQKHGLNTPDKSILQEEKKKSYKERATHGGVPICNRLKDALSKIDVSHL